MPVQNALDAWYSALDLLVSSGELSPISSTTYEKGMSKFLSWARGKQLDHITSGSVREWIAELRASEQRPTSINTWLAGVKNFFSWASENSIIANNPVSKVRGIKRSGSGKKHLRDMLTDHEVVRVLSMPDQTTVSGKRDYAWLCLMAYCAVRTTEIHRASLSDLSTNGTMTLRIQGKGSNDTDELSVVFSSKAQDAVYDWLAVRGNKPGPLFISLSDRNHGEALGLSTFRRLGGMYFKRAGVVDPRKTLHSLRHSAISKVAMHDLLKAKQVARHADINTTMIYVHEGDRLNNPGEAWIEYTNGL